MLTDWRFCPALSTYHSHRLCWLPSNTLHVTRVAYTISETVKRQPVYRPFAPLILDWITSASFMRILKENSTVLEGRREKGEVWVTRSHLTIKIRNFESFDAWLQRRLFFFQILAFQVLAGYIIIFFGGKFWYWYRTTLFLVFLKFYFTCQVNHPSIQRRTVVRTTAYHSTSQYLQIQLATVFYRGSSTLDHPATSQCSRMTYKHPSIEWFFYTNVMCVSIASF